MYDDELIGVEDVQELELELIMRRRQVYHSQAGSTSESGLQITGKPERRQEPGVETRMDSAVLAESDDPLPSKSPAGVADSGLPGDRARKLLAKDQSICSGGTTAPATTAASASRFHPTPTLTVSSEDPAGRQDSAGDSHTRAKSCGRYSILSEKLLDERRYAALVKSVDDLEYREQLFKEYGIEI